MLIDLNRLQSAFVTARADLLAERNDDGHWTGELSTSALSTATAVSALSLASSPAGLQDEHPTAAATDHQQFHGLIANGIRWLVQYQNMDGGWGDTDRSFSNVSTTWLAIAAFHLSGRADEHTEIIGRARQAAER